LTLHYGPENEAVLLDGFDSKANKARHALLVRSVTEAFLREVIEIDLA